MPAIQLARLRQQIQDLRIAWPQSTEFLRSLDQIFEYYADHAYRSGEVAEPSTLMQSYQVPPPLLREIIRGISDLAVSDPEYTLEVCVDLWAKPIFEPRLLAIYLLGEVPDREEEIDRIAREWLAVTSDEQLTEAMFQYGVIRFAAADPERYLRLVESWLNQSSTRDQAHGLRALAALLRIDSFDNFPPCFDLVTPYIRNENPDLRQDMIDVLRLLAKRSPAETTYFYLELLEGPISAGTGLLIRAAIGPLPPEQQRRVRDRLRERSR